MPVAVLQLPAPVSSDLDGPVEQAARAGDRAAWDELIHRHQRRVVVALVAQGVPAAHAKDFAQEAWLKLIAQADAGQLAVLTLPGLAIRQALFLARSAQRREGPRTDAVDVGEVAGPSAEAVFLSRERLARAQAVLASLHENAQRVFECLYGEPPLTTQQTAERLGLSLQRVRQIVCEVRKALRQDLNGESR